MEPKTRNRYIGCPTDCASQHADPPGTWWRHTLLYPSGIQDACTRCTCQPTAHPLIGRGRCAEVDGRCTSTSSPSTSSPSTPSPTTPSPTTPSPTQPPATPVPTVAPTAAPATPAPTIVCMEGVNVLENPGAETGNTGWHQDSPLGPVTARRMDASAGGYVFELNASATRDGSDRLYMRCLMQDIGVPAGATRMHLGGQVWDSQGHLPGVYNNGRPEFPGHPGLGAITAYTTPSHTYFRNWYPTQQRFAITGLTETSQYPWPPGVPGWMTWALDTAAPHASSGNQATIHFRFCTVPNNVGGGSIIGTNTARFDNLSLAFECNAAPTRSPTTSAPTCGVAQVPVVVAGHGPTCLPTISSPPTSAPTQTPPVPTVTAAPTAAPATPAPTVACTEGPCMVVTDQSYGAIRGGTVSDGYRCQVNASNCASDGEGNYGINERCSIRVVQDGFLSSDGTLDLFVDSSAQTHAQGDILVIWPHGPRIYPNGRRYVGNDRMTNVPVSAGSIITWQSTAQFPYMHAGWTVCWLATASPALTAAPPPPTNVAPRPTLPRSTAHPPTTEGADDDTTAAAAACPRNCGTTDRGGGTCRPDGRCTSCNENRLRASGRCVQSLACKGRRVQTGTLSGQGCRCANDHCHYCNRVASGDTCRVR